MCLRGHFSSFSFVRYKLFRIFSDGIGEKSRAVDALAYYFALYRRRLENFFWNKFE